MMSEFYYEVPKIRSINWDQIHERVGIKKLEVYLIDPIYLKIVAYYELPKTNTTFKEKMDYCMREMSSSENESKHILIYLTDEEG